MKPKSTIIADYPMPNLSVGDERIVNAAANTAFEIRATTGLRCSLMLPLHVAPTLRTFRGLVIEHRNNAPAAVMVVPR